MTRRNWMTLSLAAIGAVALVGCQQGGDAAPAPTASTTTTTTAAATGTGTPEWVETVVAGMPVTVGSPEELTTLVATSSFGSRRDPFALLGPESSFEQRQLAARAFGLTGFTTSYEWEEEQEVQEVFEQQPYRRLSGVLLGDAVAAILDMGNGNTYLVYPGMQIPDTEWRVHSIDADKAVLRRPGNVSPREVTVRLEGSPTGDVMPGQGGGRGPGGGMGGPPGGRGGRGGGGPGLGSADDF